MSAATESAMKLDPWAAERWKRAPRKIIDVEKSAVPPIAPTRAQANGQKTKQRMERYVVSKRTRPDLYSPK